MSAPQYVLDARARNDKSELESLGLKPVKSNEQFPFSETRHVNQTCDNCQHYEPFSGQCFNPARAGVTS